MVRNPILEQDTPSDLHFLRCVDHVSRSQNGTLRYSSFTRLGGQRGISMVTGMALAGWGCEDKVVDEEDVV